jgi:hypothetical protein
MVELAIILPMLLLLLFGVTELGRALYQQNMLTQAVELGGRYMARADGAVDTDSCTIEDNWADAVAAAENLVEFGCDDTAGCNCDPDSGECDPSILPNITVEVPVPSLITSGVVSACVITVKATAVFQSIFGGDLVSVPGFRLEGVTLNATTQERYIGI